MSCKLRKIHQSFAGCSERIGDIKGAVREAVREADPTIKPGARIAIAVGSRGITNLVTMVKTVIDSVKQRGGNPFIVPAMGSHGGANAAGQTAVLASLGITGESMGIPILSSMDVVELPRGDLDNRVYMDRHSYNSDGVILINRVKPHTDYRGPHESGLAKLCVVGLGKHAQALEIHSRGVEGLRDLVPATARRIIATGKIIMGLAVIENARDETALIKGLKPGAIMREEPALLQQARKNMPSLPVDRLDVLIIDRMGKDISGTGIDPNIIGRIRIRGQQDPDTPCIKNIVVTDITPASHGNALGVGLADIITRNLFEKIDFHATYENIFTTTFLERGKIPVVAETTARALEVALSASGPPPPGEERIMRIKDTLHLVEMYVSLAVFNDIEDRVDPVGDFVELFDEDGNLNQF